MHTNKPSQFKNCNRNLTKITNEEGTDIVFIQEPYNINIVVGIPRSCTVFTSGAGRKRAAIAIKNKRIDTILLTQFSNEDTVVVETRGENTSLILISMYFDINRTIDTDLQKIKEILTHAKGTGIIFAVDTNARSTTWHDVLTNKGGEALEEFLISRQLYIASEESCHKTFQSGRGASNIDLTIANNQTIGSINNWSIHEQDSCSDHNILKYELGNEKDSHSDTGPIMKRTRYIVTQRDTSKFLERFISIMEREVTGISTKEVGVEKLDETLSNRIQSTKIEEIVEELQDALEKACKTSFRQTGNTNKDKKLEQYKSVPWWTHNLTLLRKKVNAHMRYQRTKGSTVLREQMKKQYRTVKAEYAQTINKEKYESWKKFCTLTPANNPWNGIYRIAASKRKQIQLTTTLRKKMEQ